MIGMTNRSFLTPVLLYFSAFCLCLGLFAMPSCSSVDCKDPKNASSLQCVPADTISCAGAEYKEVTTGHSLIDIALDIYQTVSSAIQQAQGNVLVAVEDAVKSLVVKYGEPIVACVIKDQTQSTAPPTAVPSTGQKVPDVMAEIVKRHGWKFAPSPGGSGK